MAARLRPLAHGPASVRATWLPSSPASTAGPVRSASMPSVARPQMRRHGRRAPGQRQNPTRFRNQPRLSTGLEWRHDLRYYGGARDWRERHLLFRTAQPLRIDVWRPFRRQGRAVKASCEKEQKRKFNGYYWVADRLAQPGTSRHRWSSCMGRTKAYCALRNGPAGRITRALRRRVRMTTRWLCHATCFISVLFLAFSDVAEAADHGQFGPTSPEIKAWANSLENKLSEGCCSTADGWKPEEVEYDMNGQQISREDRGRVV